MSWMNDANLTQAVAEIKAFCQSAFAALTHYHTSLGSSSFTALSVDAPRQSVTEGDPATGSGYTQGYYSHAEGNKTRSSGQSSHSEGSVTTASGACSHAEGEATKAESANQHVQGMFNVADSNGTYAHIVGGGTSDSARKNIQTLDWDGNLANGSVNHATSSSAEGAVTKVATTGSGFSLVPGVRVSVKFTNANTVSSNTVLLAVNSTPGIEVCVGGSVTSSSNKCPWSAGAICEFVYDGTYWHYLGNNIDGAAGLASLRDSVFRYTIVSPNSFAWDEGNKAFYASLPTIPSGYRLAGIVATPTNGLAVLGGYYSITSNKLFVFGFVPTTGASITSSYSGFLCTLLFVKNA